MSGINTKYEKPLNLTQKEVFLNGADKSVVWTSPPHLAPVYPKWEELRAVRHNPRLTRSQTGAFRAEEDWTEYHRQRHTPNGEYSRCIPDNTCVYGDTFSISAVAKKELRSKYYVELMLGIMEYNYFKRAAGWSNHNPSLIMSEIKSITVIAIL